MTNSQEPPKGPSLSDDPKVVPLVPENPQPKYPKAHPDLPVLPKPANAPDDPTYDPFDDGNFPV